ncbi:formate transporter [Anaerocolumna cellulosilytica]|uniref:Formate transporter n=1 Tax=Anaerocolumna cellulosilytica TaxID=433286 RepID=A0A6S6RBM7_9FIRM|nr:formate/nitrite transporter family protein [Anaerocolumna cellulosilytica]MBB5195151.1 formate/nitrite transporter FocA (FNT family) [Anaerocolumna cellulosilytica]BCJ96622.1 formate transporter [Anaerocolumna cellulosilytica]
MKTFIKAIMAGIAISMGGVIYLTLENHIAGAFLFSIGLFTIYTFGLNLYTGKVCYIPNEKPAFLKTVAIVFLGNAVGTVGMGYLLRHTKQAKLIEHTQEMVGMKLSDTIVSTFIMAILCGVMMCIAVIGFQTIKDSVGKHLALILPIMVFILSGYEHSIADLFYFSMADAWGMKALLYIIVIAIGNLAGGILLPFGMKVMDGENITSH